MLNRNRQNSKQNKLPRIYGKRKSLEAMQRAESFKGWKLVLVERTETSELWALENPTNKQ